MEGERAKSTLFVRNIPFDALSSELEAFFSEVGPVRSCFVVQDRAPETTSVEGEGDKKPQEARNKGYGFIHYALPEDASRAVTELANVKFRGERKLKIELALRKGTPHVAPTKKPTTPKIVKDDQEVPKPKKKKVPFIDYCTVVLKGFGEDVNKKHIYKKVRKVGDVKEVVYPVNSEDEPVPGVAYIIYPNPQQAADATSRLNKHLFKGHTLEAQLKAVQSAKPDVSKQARLIIRNLPWSCREQQLNNIFSSYGEVVEVVLPRKYNGGPLKGFAFIQFRNVSDASNALEGINGTQIDGRPVAVDWAVDKTKFQQSEAQAAEEEEAETPSADAMDVDTEAPSTETAQTANGDVDLDAESGSEQEESDEGEEEEEEEGDEDDEDEENDEEERESSDENSDVEQDKAAGSSKTTDATEKPLRADLPSPSEGTTLFIRNIPFDTTEPDLRSLFSVWGPVRYAKITMDHETGRSRGTAFVCFRSKESADACLEEAEQLKEMSQLDPANFDPSALPQHMLSGKEKKKQGILPTHKSVLTPDPGSGIGLKFALLGRTLDVTRAVDRGEASKLADANTRKREREDKRNIYLMKEGVIFPDTPAASAIAASELQKRQMSYSARKKLLASNPSLYISKVRLSIRNLPVKVDEVALKKLGQSAIDSFKNEVKSGQRDDLTKLEKEEGWQYRPKITQAKIIRSKDRVDPSTQKMRSKGYGFLEYSTHAHALAALRYLNNNPKVFGDKKRFIVEFSIENTEVNVRREERQKRARERQDPNTISINKKRKASDMDEGKRKKAKRDGKPNTKKPGQFDRPNAKGSGSRKSNGKKPIKPAGRPNRAKTGKSKITST